eukprot:11609671-Alexandrium_andersonii.AAC.1
MPEARTPAPTSGGAPRRWPAASVVGRATGWPSERNGALAQARSSKGVHRESAAMAAQHARTPVAHWRVATKWYRGRAASVTLGGHGRPRGLLA